MEKKLKTKNAEVAQGILDSENHKFNRSTFGVDYAEAVAWLDDFNNG